MPKITYVEKRFSESTQALIDKANEIIDEYEAEGYDLTLRQLYYQMVSRDIIANKDKEYKRLGGIINDARLAGQIDWDRITDLTRELRGLAHWEQPESIVSACAQQYRIDKWAEQSHRVEVWVEKDALRNVVERACTSLDVPYFVCRGYTSQSEMWTAAQRLINHRRQGQEPIILHLGDHDPSGIDMTRDIRDRLQLFGADVQIIRIALNMKQVEQYEPPPNPAKTTDSRFASYISRYGDESWELDALNPTTLVQLITREVKKHRDESAWKSAVDEETEQRKQLEAVAGNWSTVIASLDGEDE